jgi:hypothetical protein
MRIEVIRDYSGDWRVETAKQFKYLKVWKFEKSKKIGFFSIIIPKKLPDPFNLGWSHQPGLKGPPAFYT